jgi:hypothetical protein
MFGGALVRRIGAGALQRPAVGRHEAESGQCRSSTVPSCTRRRPVWKIAANEHDQLADISTLADPQVAANLVAEPMIR